MRQEIFLPESTSGADSLYGVRTAPVCNQIQHLCVRYKSPTLAAIPLFGHTKILHTLIRVGSAAQRLLCLTRIRRPEFPARNNEIPKKKKKNPQVPCVSWNTHEEAQVTKSYISDPFLQSGKIYHDTVCNSLNITRCWHTNKLSTCGR